jgi:ribonuclease E
VIKRRQIMLVQVVKEERGTKGAALTTYISLAGRFSVLMPNSPRGGGVSRKITSAADRKRLREVIDELSLPDGMSLIVRTAGAQRPKPEIRKDCEYLLRLWDNIRERTFASSAPALIYEEADLIKRSIRDTYGKDVEEVVVDGDDAYQDAREFMRMLMPAHANKIQSPRRRPLRPPRRRAQLDAMHSPTVQLKSGGYIVINQTEALVAIDVNSGPRHARPAHRGHGAAHQPRGGGRGRAPAAAARPRGPDRHRLHRHGVVQARRHGRAAAEGGAEAGPRPHPGRAASAISACWRCRASGCALLAEHAFVACPHCQGRGLVRSLESSALPCCAPSRRRAPSAAPPRSCVHVAAVALYC